MRLMLLAVLFSLGACSGGSSSGGDSSNSSSASSSGASSSSSSSTSSSSSSSTSSSSSGNNASASHNAGQNCMTSGCHAVGDSGTTVGFYVGGSVFKSDGSAQTNATVRLYEPNTSTLVAQLETDGSGNFYTSEVISQLHIPGGALVTGVDVELEGPSGGVRSMPGVVSDAYCNLCHTSGVNGRLVVD